MRRYILAMTAAFILVAPFAMSRWGDSQAQEKPTKAQEKESKAREKEAKAKEKEAKGKEKEAPTQEKTAPAQEKTAPTQEKIAPTQEQAKGDVAAGKALYAVNCKKCHGELGEGNPRMYRLVKATVVHLGSKQAQDKSDAEIRKSMTDGFGKMEPIKELTAAQVESILAFTRTLKQ